MLIFRPTFFAQERQNSGGYWPSFLAVVRRIPQPLGDGAADHGRAGDDLRYLGACTIPSWQEVATTILPVAYGVILIMISYRYLPIFPQEQGAQSDREVPETVEVEETAAAA